MARKAIIIGAGPAGLTAAYELLTQTDIKPVIIESGAQPGGLSRTINYKGNRMDIGGHRFFSKSERVVAWWLKMLPLEQQDSNSPVALHYQNSSMSFSPEATSARGNDEVMMIRPRKSRIYFQKQFFDYPLRPGLGTLRKLGIKKLFRIAISFASAHLFPHKPELTLAQFFKNRFGNELYQTFFKSYTEKVWGVSCESLPASWGHQRVKDLDFSKAFLQSIKSFFKPDKSLLQKGTSSSLIEQFLYPKYGPGQMWDMVTKKVLEAGGEIHFNKKVTRILNAGNKIAAIGYTDLLTNEKQVIEGAYFISTMAVRDLIASIEDAGKSTIASIAAGLEYRNFIIVGILVAHQLSGDKELLKDNWIYLQDKEVRAGRLQIFNNWSEHMVKDSSNTWLGVEYFCSEGDDLWSKSDQELSSLAISELCSIGLISSASEVIDAVVEKVDKAYPAYTGTYNQFEALKTYLEKFNNLFLVGRNGMHRYNNTDHSMLTAITAVENITAGITCKNNIWEINLDEAYHEER